MCFSRDIHNELRTYTKDNPSPFNLSTRMRTRNFVVCRTCNFCFCPGNYSNDADWLETKNCRPGFAPRIGDGITPGREFHMAMNAVSILQRPSRVLIFSPGFSKDHELVRKEPLVSACKITDLKDFQHSDYFILPDSKERFDVVVACEVVEHFLNPRKEFAQLLSYLKKDGLLIVSTNIRRDVDISASVYPFLGGHTCYYSAESLCLMADINNAYIDFRSPTGRPFLGWDKRYVYITKSRESYFDVQKYFAVIAKPYSEHSAKDEVAKSSLWLHPTGEATASMGTSENA